MDGDKITNSRHPTIIGIMTLQLPLSYYVLLNTSNMEASYTRVFQQKAAEHSSGGGRGGVGGQACGISRGRPG